jgi:hypothetical protein
MAKITKAAVMNLTDAPIHLPEFGGDSVTVMPTINNQPVPVPVRFTQWIVHHENVLHILYYLDDYGNKYDKYVEEVEPKIEPEIKDE